MTKPQIVTLLTDFGTRDPYVAAMKGVLLGAAPKAQIVDISHEIPPHDVLAASFVLAQAAPYFPKDTLHVVVVDPGVGTDRRLLAARMGQQTFLMPDNGIITFIAQFMPLEELVLVRNGEFLPANVSATFQGRDILAPVAGQILNGLDLRRLGPRPDTYKSLSLPEPVGNDESMVGQVIYIDHFGNVISNLPVNAIRISFDDPERVQVFCNETPVGPIRDTYGEVEKSQPLALINSMGLLEIAVNQGRASDVFHVKVGDPVRLVRTLLPLKSY